MRHVCALLFLLFTITSPAAEWRNDQFGCSANVPDSQGWMPIEAPSTPAMTVLVAMHNPQKQAVFGINVLHNLPNANLKDPNTLAAIEKTLRSLGYQFFGRATLNVGGREWVQFPVNGGTPPSSGLIRYTSANDQVYVVSLLRGGGQEAAQDPELLGAAASVQIGAAQVAATTPAQAAPSGPAPVVPGLAPVAPAPTAPAANAPSAEKPAAETADGSVKIGSITLTKEQVRMGIYGIAGLLVLMILFRIIGGGSKEQR